jgi:hypothetical protein
LDWLVAEPTPLKNMTSSVGMMTFPTEWKVNPNSMVPVTTNQIFHHLNLISLKLSLKNGW